MLIFNIIKQELKQRFTHWSIVIIYFMLIFQGIWYTQGSYEQYPNEGLYVNAPGIFYISAAALGMLMVIIVAIITGPTLYKDLQLKTGEWLFTSPMKEKSFFIGKFLAAFFINILVAIGYPLGMLITPFSGIAEPHLFGPLPIGQLIHGFVFLTIPNLFLLTSVVFFALTFFKRMNAAYFGIVLTVMTFLILQTQKERSGVNLGFILGDPFGYIATDYSVQQMDLEQRNSGYLVMSGHQLLNRLLWTSFAVLLLVLSYFRFSFKWFLKSDLKTSKKIVEDNDDFTEIEKLSIVQRSFTSKSFFKKLFSLSILEIKNIVRPAHFKIVLSIIVLFNVLQNLIWNATYYIGDTEAITANMTMFRLGFGVFVVILLMLYAGELFFKDRINKFWEVSDSMPIPTWVSALSRFIAMCAVCFAFAMTFLLAGLFAQVVKGSADLIELDLYIYDLLGYNFGAISYILMVSLVFFLAGITKNRYITHLLGIGFFFFLILSFDLGIAEQLIYGYGFVPGVEDYTEVSEYSLFQFGNGIFQYFLMWFFLAIFFITAGIHFWRRGSNDSFFTSLSFKNKQLPLFGKALLVFSLVAFILIRINIIEEVNKKGGFELSEVSEKKDADYEKKYSYLKNVKQPLYKKVDVDIALYPKERRAVYEAKILLNKNGMTTNLLYLNFGDFITIKQIKLKGGKKLFKKWQDKEMGISAWQLPKNILNQETITIELLAKKKYGGFLQEVDQTDLVPKGSFAEIKNFLPTIGYDYSKELLENRKRKKYKLARLQSRMDDVKDSNGSQRNFLQNDAQSVTGSITVSTDRGQIPFATGKLKKEWDEGSEGERIFRKYEINKPSSFDWHIGSANYLEKKMTVSGTEVTILYSPKHPFNIADYQKAVGSSLKFLQKNIGVFPYSTLQIVEINYYKKDFYNSPNFIAISEKNGWYGDSEKLKEKAYIYYSITEQIVKQWILQNVKIADVQGAKMLITALPGAIAMNLVKQKLGKESVDVLLKAKKDQYLKENKNDPNGEPALLYADNIDYLEKNKGVTELFAVSTELGEKKFYSELKRFIKINKGKYITFKDFYDQIKPYLKQETRNKIENK